jgi:Ca2+-binding EF-hand superfamily protein
MRKLALALSAASLAIAGTAFAQPSATPQPGAERHRHGPLTRDDAAARADRMFARLDVNGDGALNPADREARRDQRFAKLDGDGDGAISRAEFDTAGAKLGQRFAARGQHKDGRHSGPHKFGGHRAAWGGHHGRHGGLAMSARMADKDGDGAVSKDEFRAAALAMFDRADANGDGTITREERKQTRGMHRPGRGAEPAPVTG